MFGDAYKRWSNGTPNPLRGKKQKAHAKLELARLRMYDFTFTALERKQNIERIKEKQRRRFFGHNYSSDEDKDSLYIDIQELRDDEGKLLHHTRAKKRNRERAPLSTSRPWLQRPQCSRCPEYLNGVARKQPPDDPSTPPASPCVDDPSLPPTIPCVPPHIPGTPTQIVDT